MRVIVNHTGACEGYHYTINTPVELPESVVVALGAEVKILGNPMQPKPQEPISIERKQIQKPPRDKMMRGYKNKNI